MFDDVLQEFLHDREDHPIQALAEQATLSLEQTLHWNTMMVFYPLCERLNGRTKPHIIECRNIPCFF
jgi:hypothetical protein